MPSFTFCVKQDLFISHFLFPNIYLAFMILPQWVVSSHSSDDPESAGGGGGGSSVGRARNS